MEQEKIWVKDLLLQAKYHVSFDELLYYYQFRWDMMKFIKNRQEYNEKYIKDKASVLNEIERSCPFFDECIMYTDIETVEITKEYIYVNWNEFDFYFNTKDEAVTLWKEKYEEDKKRYIDRVINHITNYTPTIDKDADLNFINWKEWVSVTHDNVFTIWW